MTPLVSIIIPTYNRAYLIGETLDSVLAQTYSNWECIVIDDGSNDHTEAILNKYSEDDSRIRYYKRPNTYERGGNGARNFGFTKSKGHYVNWFDDDDIMVPDRIEIQLNELIENNLDFNVCRFKDFSDENNVSFVSKQSRNIGKQLTIENFIGNDIFFGTIDFFCKRNILEDIKFDEFNQSSIEYSFFCQFLSFNLKGKFIDKVLSYRRIHPNSEESRQGLNPKLINSNKFLVYYRTYLIVEKQLQIREKKVLLKRCAVYYISLVNRPDFKIYKRAFLKKLKALYGLKFYVVYSLIMLHLNFSESGKYKIKHYLLRVL